MRDRNPTLDGLRAVAALAVVLHHSFVPGFGWGWLGVDAFFVLSGYLITGLLLKEQASSDKISFWRFYLRRAARLYPALLLAVVVSLTLPTGTSVLHGLWALAYLSDAVRSVDGSMGWLGHTWSLAVEEHFYLAWPLALAFCRSRRAVALLAGAGAAASLGIALAADGLGPLGSLGYNSTPTRAWELLAGCLLACAPAARLGRVTGCVVGTLIPSGAALGVAISWHFHAVRAVPLCLAVVAASACVVYTHRSAWSPLSLAPLPRIGLISYGVYLYHPVPLAFLESAGWHARLLAALLFGIPAAAASHRWVEQPIQRWVRERTTTAHTVLPAASRQLVPSDQIGLLSVESKI